MSTPPLHHRSSSPTPAFVARQLALISVGWGSSFLCIKLMQGEISPFVVAACRGGLAGTALALWMVARGQSPLPRRHEIIPWLILGIFSGALPNVLVPVGLLWLDTGPAALTQSASPLMTAVAAHFLFADERMSLRRLAGVVIGFLGVALLIGPKAFGGGSAALGVAIMFCVAACYTATNLYTRTIRDVDASRLALGQQAVSGVAGIAAALVVVGPAGFTPVADHPYAVLGLGLWATAIPMVLFMHLIQAAGPTRAAMTGYSVPTVAALIGIVVLGETLTPWQVLGCVIALIGVSLVTLSKARVP